MAPTGTLSADGTIRRVHPGVTPISKPASPTRRVLGSKRQRDVLRSVKAIDVDAPISGAKIVSETVRRSLRRIDVG